jgi:electron transfer flavoprotein alpha subunit
MSTIVFIDTRGNKIPKAAQEAVTYASQLAGGPVTAVTFGDGKDLETLGANGAGKVIVARQVTTLDSQQLTRLVVDVATKEGATTIVLCERCHRQGRSPPCGRALEGGSCGRRDWDCPWTASSCATCSAVRPRQPWR